MIFEIKNKLIVSGVSAIFIVIISVGLFLIFKNKPSGPANNVKNSNNELAQPIVDNNNEEKEAKPSFDLSSKKDVYKIKKDDKWVYVIDGQEGLAYDQVANLTFSLNGEKIAYSASLDNQTYLVVNNSSETVPYKQITNIVFSPDGNRIAYVADNGGNFVIVLDSKASKEYQKIGTLETEDGKVSIVFSPDSQKIAYKVVTENGAFVVVDQQAGKTYTDITNFQFSDDSVRFAYQAESGTHQVTVINNSEEISNENTETQNSTSSSNTNGVGATNTGSTSAGEASSGAARSAHYQGNCSGSNAIMDCR
jgi:hypothetical protein